MTALWGEEVKKIRATATKLSSHSDCGARYSCQTVLIAKYRLIFHHLPFLAQGLHFHGYVFMQNKRTKNIT